MNGQEPSAIAIISGGGVFPLAVADALKARGRSFTMFPLLGFADSSVERYPHHWVRLGALGRLFRLMRESGCREVVMIGSLIRPKLSNIGFDFKTLLLLPKIARAFGGGDDKLLSGLADMLEEQGFKVYGAHELVPELLMPEGAAGRLQPSADEREDIRIGFEVIRALGPYDVGQAVVVADRRVLALEAAGGTAEMLSHLAELRRKGRIRLAERSGVLVKAPKPKQDRRIDLPAIGPDTVEQANAAGLRGIAVEAGGTIIADPSGIADAADTAGVFLCGFKATP